MDSTTLASPENLEALLKQAESELEAIQPQIEEIENQLKVLHELKQSRQRLLTLKMSLSALLESSTQPYVESTPGYLANTLGDLAQQKLQSFEDDYTYLSTHKTFHPDLALQQVTHALKQRDSLNNDMFRAVVLNGGKASTAEIKTYLVEAGIKQPQTGEGFEDAPLTEISSRANYLVRKGILKALDRGVFYTTLGWN
jgi:hypothetical protein